MLRLTRTVLSLFGFASIIAVAAFIGLLATGILTPEKISNFLKFNPIAARVAPASDEAIIQTSFARLKVHKINFASKATRL